MSYTSIIGTGSYIPENIIDNNYISQFVDTSDEWITEKTDKPEDFQKEKILLS